MSGPLLKVEDLRVSFETEDGNVQAVDGVSFDVSPGEVVAIVGESGCGKSVTAMSLMGLTRDRNATITGTANLEGTDLISADDDDLRRLRGDDIAMIFQDPMTSLNPVYRIGDQISEQIKAHRDIGDDEAHEQAVELLEQVGIPGAAAEGELVPPRVLRRHAAARDDRDGAFTRAPDPHRR